MAGPGADEGLSADERAAVRAYLQRTEVRLSTVHRVASALLSGAGLLVLLPAVARDSVVDVVHGLLRGSPDLTRIALVVAVGLSMAVPSMALVVLLRDLTRFYFHANHVRHSRGETFAPRFTLTALRLPADELDETATDRLAAARGSDAAIELLVPANEASRAHVDRRLAVYGLGVEDAEGDPGRAQALFALASSHPRDLLEEVAKVEHGLARHVLRVQTIVLRYVKALLALLTTAMAVFATAAVVDGTAPVGATDGAWVAGIMLVWAPTAMWAVTGPVRWLEGQLRGEGATATAVSDDPDLAGVEVTTVRLALAGAAAAGVAMVSAVAGEGTSARADAIGLATLGACAVAAGAVLWRWGGRAAPRRLLGR